MGAIRRCYEQGLKTSPTLAGTVRLRFVIRSDGSVSNLATSGDLGDTTVESCIGQTISTLRFPKPEKAEEKARAEREARAREHERLRRFKETVDQADTPERREELRRRLRELEKAETAEKAEKAAFEATSGE